MTRSRGFTLIELLITIGLVAVLSAGVVTVIGTGPQKNSRDAKRRADLEKIASALELYRSDNGGYPDSTCSGGSCLATTYFGTVPRDPSTNNLYTYTPSSCSGSKCSAYVLCAWKEITNTACGWTVNNP